ncbi:MAG: starch synthase [Betaproteobacteria bacterium RIFCSPLOWO2_02_FULL_62_17]|nr:MAG: starch synthase [Betaproteobacteria bacterium RIFCSPLOWO2_02_FULL_62_17]
MRVLYVSTEVYPALKTGGLADVNAALPQALTGMGVDVRLLLPGFPAFMHAAEHHGPAVSLGPAFGLGEVSVSRALLNGVPVYLVEAPQFYGRAGTPYGDAEGRDWPDNHLRFALLGWAAARFADGSVGGWRPDIVHGHDWHAGLAPAYLAARGVAGPGSVFTVHNLAFQGQFPGSVFPALGLPPDFFGVRGVEFHGMVNFVKAGLHYADRITTVSPTYAREIQTAEHGFGLDGLLSSRAGELSGILNGVDRAKWNPSDDEYIAARFDAVNFAGKAVCKAKLRAELGLSPESPGPLFGIVSRITQQKGLDLLLGAMPELIAAGGQLALLGSGDAAIAERFRAAALRHPRQLAVRLGYDEALAHRIIAAADVIAVPSRFEPCGLTQMYGMTYGALPLVRRVGGLADTVRDADAGAIAAGTATGFVFEEASASALSRALERVFALWREPATWSRLLGTAMRQDFGWTPSARRYVELYRELRPRT